VGGAHIYAKTDNDAFFVQGFNVARDRLFQLDLLRRKGLGHLSDAFGPAYVEQDRAARLFLYRGDMTQEWNSYGPEARRDVGRFVAGINVYIAWLDRHPQALPYAFGKLGYRPERWARYAICAAIRSRSSRPHSPTGGGVGQSGVCRR